MSDFYESGDFCACVKWVSWVKPRRGAYCYVAVWHKKDPQVAVKCEHRHRTPGEAMKCGRRYIRSGQAKADLPQEG